MCACEPGFTCSRCAGTPHDPAYPELPDAPRPADEDRAGGRNTLTRAAEGDLTGYAD